MRVALPVVDLEGCEKLHMPAAFGADFVVTLETGQVGLYIVGVCTFLKKSSIGDHLKRALRNPSRRTFSMKRDLRLRMLAGRTIKLPGRRAIPHFRKRSEAFPSPDASPSPHTNPRPAKTTGNREPQGHVSLAISVHIETRYRPPCSLTRRASAPSEDQRHEGFICGQ